MNKSQTVDTKEIEKFSQIADQWWDLNGKFKPLHKFNPIRVNYIKKKAQKHFGLIDDLRGLDVLDIGCGGGLLSEPMARFKANVTAIDASEKNISVASIHAKKSNLTINYQHTTVEELAAKNKIYDIILNMEVIEHVADYKLFLHQSCLMLKPGGLMFIATINRTIKSFLLAILGAEYILRWLPVGTHNWNKFLKPSEIEPYVNINGLLLEEIQGVSYNPLVDKWHLSNDMDVNYMMLISKQNEKPKSNS
jgi:2-polyprenyl-6-hydroxyphenyl methylase/3-demethylubiquinone-9 3-methyltransferase